MLARAPWCIGRSPRYFGFAGSVTSTNDVPSVRPTSANSRPVVESVQPQMPLSSVPRFAPIVLFGRKATRSASLQSNALALPPWHFTSPPATRGSTVETVSLTVAVSRQAPLRAVAPIQESGALEEVGERRAGDREPVAAAMAAPSRVEYPAGGVTSICTSFHCDGAVPAEDVHRAGVLVRHRGADQQVVPVAGQRRAESGRPGHRVRGDAAGRRPGGCPPAGSAPRRRPGCRRAERRPAPRSRRAARRRRARRRPCSRLRCEPALLGPRHPAGPRRNTNAWPAFQLVESKVQGPGAPTRARCPSNASEAPNQSLAGCRSPASRLESPFTGALPPAEDDDRAPLAFTARRTGQQHPALECHRGAEPVSLGAVRRR